MATRTHGLYTRLDHPSYQHANESCLVTGTTGPGVDLGIDLEGYGGVYLSLNVIKEIAEVAGFSVNEEGKALEEENAHLQHDLAVHQWAVALLEEELDAVSRLIARAAAPQGDPT